jgi:hypothetical protein
VVPAGQRDRPEHLGSRAKLTRHHIQPGGERRRQPAEQFLTNSVEQWCTGGGQPPADDDEPWVEHRADAGERPPDGPPGVGDSAPHSRVAGVHEIQQRGQVQAGPIAVPQRRAERLAAGRYQVDDGRYGLELATSSSDVAQEAFIDVSGALKPVPAVVTAKPVSPGGAACVR